MALNKHGIDWKAITRDQKAIDKLPNRGRVKAVDHSSHEKALSKFDKHITKHFANNPDVHKDSESHQAHQKKIYGKGGMSAYLKKHKVI